MTAQEVKQAVERLGGIADLSERRMAFFRLCQALGTAGENVVRELLPLLEDWDFEIRKEAAFWLEAAEVKMTEEEEIRLEYALLQFDNLKVKAEKDKKARAYLMKALRDRSLRVREKVLRVFSLSDCRNAREVMVYLYGRGEYVGLLDLAKEKEMEEEVAELLREGLQPERNIPHHQRQCSFALKQLGHDEEPVLQRTEGKAREEAKEQRDALETDRPPLEKFLDELNRQGVLTKNGIIYPKIQVGSVTGRITYRDPGLQTWPSEKRTQVVRAEEGFGLWRYDFREIEPRILCHFLIESFWLSLEDAPTGDFYGMVPHEDRREAKRWLNKLINGGRVVLPENAPGKLRKFKEAVDYYRMELMELAAERGYVETLGGRKIPVPDNGRMLRRKIMSYKIQGSAADFFNEAAVALHGYLALEKIPARIVFLLYDEIWVEIKKDSEEETAEGIRAFLDHVGAGFELFLPVPIRCERIGRNQNYGARLVK